MGSLRSLGQSLTTLAAGIVIGAVLVGGHATASAAPPARSADPPPVGASQFRAAAANPTFSTDVVAQTVDVATSTASIRWDKPEYTAAAGDVTFVLRNPSPLRRTFTIEGNDIREPSITIEWGETKMYTLRGLTAGQYRIVDNMYAKSGATATLTVR